PSMPLDHGILLDAETLGYRAVAGNLDAATIRSELQAVIHAAYVVAFEASERKWRMAMPALVGHRREFAIRLAVKQYRPLDDGDAEQAVYRQFMAPGGHIPAVAHVKWAICPGALDDVHVFPSGQGRFAPPLVRC